MTRLCTASLALAALGAFSGCLADNDDQGLFFSRVLAPTQDCTFTAMDAEAFLPRGSYGLLANEPYTATAQVVSRITATDTNIQQRTVQLHGVNVDIKFVDGKDHGVADEFLNFKVLTSGPVAPNGGITDTSFPMVPYQLANAVAGTYVAGDPPIEITATVELVGELGGDTVKSQKFIFPIDLRPDVGPIDAGTCPLPPGTSVAGASNGCSSQQDSGFEVCCHVGTQLICPATVTPTPPST